MFNELYLNDSSSHLFIIYLFTFKHLFIFERQREAEHEQGRGRERETQNPKQAPGSELFVSTEPDAGLELTNCETVT